MKLSLKSIEGESNDVFGKLVRNFLVGMARWQCVSFSLVHGGGGDDGGGPSSSSSSYISAVNRLPMLTAEQETSLARKFRDREGSSRLVPTGGSRFAVETDPRSLRHLDL